MRRIRSHLLRARRQRPCRRATKQRDELAASHGAPLSARVTLPHHWSNTALCITANSAVSVGSFASWPARAVHSRNVRSFPKADVNSPPCQFRLQQTAPIRSPLAGVNSRPARQAHGKHRALAWFARHRHVAAHHARQFAREGKAKAGSAVAPRCQGVGLGEILE